MRQLWILPFLCGIAPFAAPLKDARLQAYFADEVARISSNCLAGFDSIERWNGARPKFREQLFEMLSLAPLPERSDLKPMVTGKVEREEFVVEKLHFQSLPGLYVTANFYLPKKVEKPLPTILYVCGHGIVKTNGVSYGNKVAYQHHGAWFARNGYACLLIDTIQLGEIEGIHHGTYREGMWWWNSRGYTPAGVEAWNCIRALDYLETRSEVDTNRLGVTGRSGGGAYSWWIAALDDRIKVAAPVAGMTDLKNHVVDGVVEGHCDCMFIVNTYRWDYPLLAALAAPRPLLLCNSDKDTIFPLDGVLRVHSKVARIYSLFKAQANLGLLITEGPHKDTQDLQLPVFRWFNRHLKGEDPVIEMAAVKFFAPAELKVFDRIPEDQRNSAIHESFVPRAVPAAGADPDRRRAEVRRALLDKVFAGWPERAHKKILRTHQMSGGVIEVEFEPQHDVTLTMRFRAPAEKGQTLNLRVVTADQLADPNDLEPGAGCIAVRGTGPERPKNEPKEAVQIRRRYMLIGQTLDGMRVWDLRMAAEILRSLPELRDSRVQLSAEGGQAANLLLAAFLSDGFPAIQLANLPRDDQAAPDYLNFLRVTSLREIASLMPESVKVAWDGAAPELSGSK